MKEFKSKDPLFQPYQLGSLQLPNRVLMAPLTRARAAQPGDVPQLINVEYYRQRASAGLIFSEASPISPQGKGYAYTPDIYTDAQIQGWKKVTDAVHAQGGRIHLQLWHVGRVSHPKLQPNGALPVAPSAIKPEGAMPFIGMQEGRVAAPTPRALKTEEIPEIVEQFRQAAINAKRAEFDGVELHGANGYLIDQFLRSSSNRRTDQYGGSLENRLRFPLQVVEALIDVWGAHSVGVRVSPGVNYNGMQDDDNPVETFGTFAKALDNLKVAYIEIVENLFLEKNKEGRDEAVINAIRQNFSRTYIANGNYTRSVLNLGFKII